MKRISRALLNYLICLVFLINLIFFSYLPSVFPATSRDSPSTQTSPELRGVWLTNVSSGVLFAPWAVDRAIQKLSELHFNTVYPVVWNRGHTFYPSRVAERVTGQSQAPLLTISRGGSDVLEEIIQDGHQHGLSVIPWFEYGLMVPAESAIANKHPDWLTNTKDGKMYLSEDKANEDFLKNAQSKKSGAIAQWLHDNRQKIRLDKSGSIPFILTYKSLSKI